MSRVTRSKKLSFATSAVAFLIWILAGCAPGEGPFRQVQFCLDGAHELVELKSLLRSLAVSEGMKFNDRSDEATEEIRRIRQRSGFDSLPDRLVVLSVRREDGLGMGVGNIDGSLVQFVVGFSNGRDALQTREFADKTVDLLGQHWAMVEVPSERGAFLLEDCEAATRQTPN